MANGCVTSGTSTPCPKRPKRMWQYHAIPVGSLRACEGIPANSSQIFGHLPSTCVLAIDTWSCSFVLPRCFEFHNATRLYFMAGPYHSTLPLMLLVRSTGSCFYDSSFRNHPGITRCRHWSASITPLATASSSRRPSRSPALFDRFPGARGRQSEPHRNVEVDPDGVTFSASHRWLYNCAQAHDDACACHMEMGSLRIK